jgi:hypothetical protein
MARYIKEWIELTGWKKLLWGCDGCGITLIPGTWCTRTALALVLARLIDEQFFTREEAAGVAEDILLNNALRFYNLEKT